METITSPRRAWQKFLRDVDLADARSSYEREGRRDPVIRGHRTMRVMVLVKATKDSEAGVMPSTELL
jgi:hypothetical protein